MKVIMEDLAPYLISIETVPNTARELVYTFEVHNVSEEAYNQLIGLSKRLKCWKHPRRLIFTWNTDSIVLRDRFNKINIKAETVEDIPTHILDASTFNISHTISGRFKSKKENEMSKDKFSAENKTYIKVNGKDFSLTSPFNAEKSLGVILELTERLSVLKDKMKQLTSINDSEDQTDLISVDKVVIVATDEISEIKEMIDFINDNIEEVE